MGLLGPGPTAGHVHHATAMGGCQSVPPARVMDLGSGGGVPGLVLALLWPEARFVFLDASLRSARFLTGALKRLGLEGRAEVVRDRAELAGRRTDLREGFDLVVARSFGHPAVTAECASGFVHPGGLLLVSEPPGATGDSRWSSEGLRILGFGPARGCRAGGFSFVAVAKRETAGSRWPRRSGVPAKRPLWR